MGLVFGAVTVTNGGEYCGKGICDRTAGLQIWVEGGFVAVGWGWGQWRE